LLSGSFYGLTDLAGGFALDFPWRPRWFHAKWLKVVHFIGVAKSGRAKEWFFLKKTAIRVSDRTIKKPG
jgi:hypothetical protein